MLGDTVVRAEEIAAARTISAHLPLMPGVHHPRSGKCGCYVGRSDGCSSEPLAMGLADA